MALLLVHDLFDHGQHLLHIVGYLNDCKRTFLIVLTLLFLGLFSETIFKLKNELSFKRILISGPQMVFCTPFILALPHPKEPRRLQKRPMLNFCKVIPHDKGSIF